MQLIAARIDRALRLAAQRSQSKLIATKNHVKWVADAAHRTDARVDHPDVGDITVALAEHDVGVVRGRAVPGDLRPVGHQAYHKRIAYSRPYVANGTAGRNTQKIIGLGTWLALRKTHHDGEGCKDRNEKRAEV